MPSRVASQKQRIVSLVPSVTSILLALGVRDELVGVSKWCRHVADIGSRAEVGDCWKLEIDAVMRLQPTLLIGSVPFDPKTVGQILEQPVSFLALNPRSLADIERDILTLGAVANRREAAERLVRRMRGKFGAVARRVKTLRTKGKPRVYCEAWSNPRISSPPWVAELVKIAGGNFVLPPGARITDEQVAEAVPDVIVLAWAATNGRSDPRTALENPLWQSVPAVKNRRVFVVRDELLNTPGPPLMEGVEELSRIIHERVDGKR